MRGVVLSSKTAYLFDRVRINSRTETNLKIWFEPQRVSSGMLLKMRPEIWNNTNERNFLYYDLFHVYIFYFVVNFIVDTLLNSSSNL